MYIDDIVRKDILKDLEERLNSFKIDSVIDSSYRTIN